MSKAFTRDEDEAPPAAATHLGLPVPTPNWMTPDGLRRLRAELAAGPLPARARDLSGHLATAEPITPSNAEVVAFGVAVTVEDEAGRRSRYRIVGVIEASPREGLISWRSPLATSLLGAHVGDTVTGPRGELVVVAIEANCPHQPGPTRT